MQHIGELTVWPEHSIPRSIILAGGRSIRDETNTTAERIEIGEDGIITNSQSLPGLSFTIRDYCAVTLGTIGTDESKGLLIGGSFRMVENGNWEYQKTIEFELSTNNWDTNIPKTKCERWLSSSSTLSDGSPAICGGYEMLSRKTTEIRGEDGEWNCSEIAILQIERRSHGTTVVNGSLFVIGGWTDNGPTNTIEMWDPRDKSGWNNSSIPPMKKKRYSHSVSSVDDSIFVFGGISGCGNFEACESLDIRSNKWKTISSMPLKRSEHSSVAIGDQILIVGRPEKAQIDSYDPITNTWTTLQHKLLQTRYAFQAFAL
jgi:hypothetical protein